MCYLASMTNYLSTASIWLCILKIRHSVAVKHQYQDYITDFQRCGYMLPTVAYTLPTYIQITFQYSNTAMKAIQKKSVLFAGKRSMRVSKKMSKGTVNKNLIHQTVTPRNLGSLIRCTTSTYTTHYYIKLIICTQLHLYCWPIHKLL